MQENMANKLYDYKQIEMDRRAMELAKAEEECRRAINNAVKDYNNALVREREREKGLDSDYWRFSVQVYSFCLPFSF